MNTYTATVTLPNQPPETRQVEAECMIDAIKLIRAEYITARISLVGAKIKVVRNDRP
jgi:hypothetical protein